MMLSLLVATLLTAAPSSDPRLHGAWGMNGQMLFTLSAGGKGSGADGEALRWSAAAGVLTFTGAEGEAEEMRYRLQDGKLVIEMGGVALALERSSAAPGPKASEPAERAARPQHDTGAPLARLLLSTAWCSFSYKNGTTRTSRVVFSADGSWSSGANRETQWSGANGSYYGQNGSGGGGQWSVQGEVLSMSMPPNYPALTAVPYTVKQNSNGYPILTVAGTEYMTCN